MAAGIVSVLATALDAPEVIAVPGQSAGRLLAALYGPTSSGKTALAVEVASRLESDLGHKVVIISADSRQVYRYMDIGTSKTTPEEMRGIPHEMLDVTEPVRKFELEEYARLARRHITDALAAGTVPFIVGGTGVYVKALLEGWELDQVGAVRSSLRRDFPPSMAEDAYAMLRRLDRQAAARVHPHNYTAVINALAARMAAEDRTVRPERSGLATVVLGLDPGPRALAERVARTYDDQLRRGLFGEILDLNDRYQLDTEMRRRGHDSPNQVLHTHGYREYFEVAAERGKNVSDLTEAERAEVGNRVVRHIRGYTGRQRTWFSKLPAARMVRSTGQAYHHLAQAMQANRLSLGPGLLLRQSRRRQQVGQHAPDIRGDPDLAGGGDALGQGVQVDMSLCLVGRGEVPDGQPGRLTDRVAQVHLEPAASAPVDHLAEVEYVVALR